MTTQCTTSRCSIDFPTVPIWFRSIRQLICTATLQSGFTNRESGQIAMAVDEAISNIYRHGYQGSETGRIRLAFLTSRTPEPHICIEIEDDAMQVDVELIKSRALDDIKPGGLGVHLIQTVMDEATWVKREDGGMKLTMKKTQFKN